MSAPCKNEKLIKLCSDSSGAVPCCPDIKAKASPDLHSAVLRERGKVLWGRVDCVDLFCLRKEFLDAGSFEFKGVSWCMFPVIKKGDVLKVEHAGARDMKVGDIPAYKSGDKLFAHRVVGKKVIEGKQYIMTRPDGLSDLSSEGKRESNLSKEEAKHGKYLAKEGGSGNIADPERGEKVSDDEILGRIKEVRRGRKILSTKRRKATPLDNISYEIAKMKAKFKRSAREFLSKWLAKIQSFWVYRIVTAKILKKLESTINFQVALPRKGALAIYNYMPLERCDISALKEHSFFYIRMKLKNTPVGCAAFLNRPEACPHKGLSISDLYVRVRYRAIGLESVLSARAAELLRKYENKSPSHR